METGGNDATACFIFVNNVICEETPEKKTLTTDAERNTSDVEQIKNRRKQNFEAKMRQTMQLDKDYTERSNLNSKYLSVTLVLKYPASFIRSFSRVQ